MKKKLYRAEGGFTLVELLVTIAILAVLFGVVTLSLGGIGSTAEDNVNAAEKAVVQSAIDIYMAEYNTSSVDAWNETAGSEACLDDTAVLGTQDSTTITIGDYLRNLDSNCEYGWVGDGTVTQGDCTCN